MARFSVISYKKDGYYYVEEASERYEVRRKGGDECWRGAAQAVSFASADPHDTDRGVGTVYSDSSLYSG